MCDSFVFYKSFYDAVRGLNPEDYKATMEAILMYAFEEQEPEMDSQIARIVFTLVKPQIDANTKRRVNGCKGGRPPKTIGYENEKPLVSKTDENKKPNVNVNVNENVNVNVNDKEKRTRFVPPSIEQVKEYCKEHDINIDAQRFIDYYTANGWKVGKNPMKDWKATVRNWNRSNKPETSKKVHNFDGRSYDFEALEREASYG